MGKSDKQINKVRGNNTVYNDSKTGAALVSDGGQGGEVQRLPRWSGQRSHHGRAGPCGRSQPWVDLGEERPREAKDQCKGSDSGTSFKSLRNRKQASKPSEKDIVQWSRQRVW